MSIRVCLFTGVQNDPGANDPEALARATSSSSLEKPPPTRT
jgi:hypothetical protein